ncbi:MAG TPA: Nif11-like leader peptide family RiPP precursor [Thermoanaerobaculia bacterium]|nr:Nif11-like leader peptide family RiPP precursor [Thermoanaerobaculia bacterium]
MTRARDFVDRLQSDPGLAQQVQVIAADREGALDRLVALGAEHGYSFDAQELTATLRPGVAGQELTEDDLQRVHGGIIAILIGLVQDPRTSLQGQFFPKVQF